MLVEVVVWGGSTLIGGLGVGYYFLSKFDNKVKANLEDVDEMGIKKNSETGDVVPSENNKQIDETTAEDELYRLAKIANATSYFDYDKIKPPKKPSRTEKYWDRDSNDKIYKIECEIWELDYRQWKIKNDKAHSFDLILVDFMEKRLMKINREHEIEMLIYKYLYTWDTYEQIIEETNQLNTPLSDAVKNEIHRGITQFIVDYCELEYRILKHQKQLKDEMDAVTNNSFMQRLQLEREYIDKVRNKEEFDLTLNNI